MFLVGEWLRNFLEIGVGTLCERFQGWVVGTLPPLGVFKINTDGSSRGNPGHAGIGGVGCDSSRQV